MTTYVYIELKTMLASGVVRTVARHTGESYALYDDTSGDFMLQLPNGVSDIRPGMTLYEDQAIKVRT